MFDMIFIKSIVISNPICKFNINRRITGFHQFQIHKQPSRAAVSVDKRVDALKLNMKPCKPGDGMLCAVPIVIQQLFHFRLNQIRLDRFMLRLSIGYPSLEQEVLILKQTEGGRPVDSLRQVATLEEVRQMQAETAQVHVAEDLYRYVATLCAATREHPLIRLGASPRAGAALIRACRASAWMAGRDYVIPGDVHLLYYNVLEHRVMPDPQARLSDRTIHDLLAEVMESVPQPKLV